MEFSLISLLIFINIPLVSWLGTGLAIKMQTVSFLREDLRRERAKNDKLRKELFELKHGKWRER